MQDYSLSVVMDVVKRYDVDGVHFDDYFYPYKAHDGSGKELDFPDDASWRRFGAGGKLSRDDWRRENVNAFIQRVYKSIKAAKPWVKFGVSPFGIWRPKNPAQIQGLGRLCAHFTPIRANGWPTGGLITLRRSFTGQLTRQTKASPRCCDGGRSKTPGAGSFARGWTRTRSAWSGSPQEWQPQEIVNQIRLTRSQPGASGHIHWSMKSLMRNSAFDELLEREVYQQPALMPPSPWLGRTRPGKPEAHRRRRRIRLPTGNPLDAGRLGQGLALAVADHGPAASGRREILPAAKTTRTWNGAPPEVVAVSAVNRSGEASSPSVLQARVSAK